MQSDETDREARIRERAYHIWVEQGRPDGSHDEHWRRAEQQITEEEATELTVDAVSSAAGENPPPSAPRPKRSATGRAPSEAGPAPPEAEPASARRSRSKPPKSDAPGAALSESADD